MPASRSCLPSQTIPNDPVGTERESIAPEKLCCYSLSGFNRPSDNPTRKAVFIVRTARGIKVLASGGLILAVSLSTLAFAGTASAASPLSAVTCTHLVGSATSLTATLSGCSATTGGSGTISSFVPTGGNVAWSDGTSTDYTATDTTGGTACPSTTTQFNIKGSVSSSTNKSIPVGAVVKMTVCANPSTGKLKNAKGTRVKF